jgi:hypothetical protein
VVAILRRHPRLSVLAGLLLAGAIATPIVAYAIVPAFVKSTLVEEFPSAGAPAAGATGASATATPPEAQTIANGELVKISAVDYGSGGVRIVSLGADRFVRFENVDIAGAPDMYVYLSDRTDGKPGTYLDLGKLKATNGSFNYAVPATADLAGVKSVVVWCRAFSVTVTYAVMQRP